MYTLIHVCIILLCIVLKTDHLCYQLAVWYMLFLKYSLFKTSSLLQDEEQYKLYSYFFVSNCKDWFFVLDLQVVTFCPRCFVKTQNLNCDFLFDFLSCDFLSYIHSRIICYYCREVRHFSNLFTQWQIL
jgi:hypothetical protein